MKHYEQMTICVDMAGCPNRCRHCWIAAGINGHMSVDDLIDIRNRFKTHAQKLEVYSWYREPDYSDQYRALWKLEHELSDFHQERFELMSFYRAVRDPDYVSWLTSIGLKEAQLTFFGMEEATDYYVGRKGAFNELNETISLLIKNGIAPRIQIFIRKDTIGDLPRLLEHLRSLDLESRCKDLGRTFNLFAHQGTCDGESRRSYQNWITDSDLLQIPKYLLKKTLSYFKANDTTEVFGRTESELFDLLSLDDTTCDIRSGHPVFYIDKDFNVYPNFTSPSSQWRLGNLKTQSVNDILDTYQNCHSKAQSVCLETPFLEMVRAYGNQESRRLFTPDDYKIYLINRYIEKG